MIARADPCDRSFHVELVWKKRPRQHHDHSVDGKNALESLLHRTNLIVLSVDGVAENERVAIPHHDSKGRDEHRIHQRIPRASASHLATQREPASRT